jgi:hypothetical protein
MPGLSVSDVVSVEVNLSPAATPLRNFGALCLAGSSPVIDPQERIRAYTTLDGVAADFGSAAPEYLAADLFFAQNPKPSLLYVGRFAQNPTHGVLHGGIMSGLQRATALAQLKSVINGTMGITIDGTDRVVSASPAVLIGGAFTATDQTTLATLLRATLDGGFDITIDGAVVPVSALDFSGIDAADDAQAMQDAAAVIASAIVATGTCAYVETSGTFQIRSATTGTASTITYAVPPAAGTDLSGELRLTAATGALAPMDGKTGMDFTGVTNLNGAATILNNALVGGACWFDGARFHIASLSQGPASTVGYAHAAGTGVDISGIMRLTQATGAAAPVDGMAAETPLAAAVALRAHPEWYGLQFALQSDITQDDYVAVASFIEACDPISIFGYTTQNSEVLDPTVTTDIASEMKSLNLRRTFGQYSSYSPYASASAFGRAFTVDFEASDTVITLNFKQEPLVVGETLSENQARALQAKNCNVFVFYSNDVAILQEGVMASSMWFDVTHGTDWLANRIQTDIFNALYTAPAKIPQTNAGMHILTTVTTNALDQGVTNGLIAAGQWNAPGFGQLSYGQMLPTGYYVWAPRIETQPQSIREQRIAPTIQCAVKLAGAIHKADVIVNVNQ